MHICYMNNFIMFLVFSIHSKANKNLIQIRFLVTNFTKLYKNFIYYVITFTLNVHRKLEILSKIN